MTDAVEKGKNELIEFFTCAPVETVILPSNASQRAYEGCWLEIGLIMCPPTSFSGHCTSASEKICSAPQRDFFNSIDPIRKCSVHRSRSRPIAFTLAVGTGARADTILLYHFDPGTTLNFGGGDTYDATGAFSYDVTTSMVTAVGYIPVQTGTGSVGPFILTLADTKSPTDVLFYGDCCSDLDEFIFARSLALGGTDPISNFLYADGPFGIPTSPIVGFTGSVSTTPLPSTWAMLIAGFVGLGFFAYRGSKKNSVALSAA
jgi:hypothetical protein